MVNPQDPANSTSVADETASHWADMTDRDHFVQLYADEQQIIEAVAGYFVNGIRFNETCVMIGTSEHNHEIEKLVRYIEPRVDAAIAGKSFIILDAHETLSRFMVGGMPRKVPLWVPSQ